MPFASEAPEPKSGSGDAVLDQARVAKRYLYQLGMPGPALSALERLLEQATSEAARAEIAWTLLEWYGRRQGDEARDIEPYLTFAAWPPGDAEIERRIAIVRVRQLAKRDREAAKALLETELAKHPHPDLMLAMGNLGTLDERVHRLNQALALFDLAPIRLTEGEKDPLDRLRPAALAESVEGPLVSVIVPVFRAADTIGTALASLGWQSWTNLEIIVVDDASGDDTVGVIREAMAADPRIRLLVNEVNSGAYVSRNRGLAEATGAFVTVHDADDWSHPAKIERQMRHLLDHPEMIANISMKVRIHPTLECVGVNPRGGFIAANASSLLFRREETLAELGSWDSVRVGADSEFIWRLEARFGSEAVPTLDTGPIALQRRSGGSLTGSGPLAYPGFAFGGRKEYGEIGRWHRRRHGRDQLHYAFPMAERPYPAPTLMLPTHRRDAPPRHFDVVIASDFRQRSESNAASIEEIEANAALGLSTGLIQLSVFDLEAERRRHPWLADAVQDGHAEMLVYGERVVCDLLVIRDPRVLVERQNYVPAVEAKDVRIVADRPPLDVCVDPDRPLFDPAACDAHAERLFGRRPTWHPVNPTVRAALMSQGVDVAVTLSDEDWPDIIQVVGLGDRGGRAEGKALRIGRHGPDHWSAWSANADDILAAYPDGRDPRVFVLGSIDSAARILGGVPQSWKVSQFKRRDQIGAFLSRLDAYVYFAREGVPHYGQRHLLEAMAAGVPLVLDQEMETTFGARARYAVPQRMRKALKEMAAEPETTDRMVAEAHSFIERVHSRSAYANRLQPLVAGLSRGNRRMEARG